MPAKRKIDDISREEDFRDYDDRNIDEGWPYDDASGAGTKPVDNAAYGQPAANFDSDRNGGYQVDNAGFDGLEEAKPDPSLPYDDADAEDADSLEERINDAIEALGVTSMDLLDIHVDQGRVTLQGEVDEAEAAGAIIREIRRIPGVKMVINNIRLAGVDTRIPDDD